ncbi:serine hydrolase [Chryseobacterium sp. A301]
MRKSFVVMLAITLGGFTQAQIAEKQLDQLVENTLKTFEVPGISVGVIKDGKVIYAKGHGVASLTSKAKMDEKTLVGIASNSKGFTATALAMLVDEGKLSWDDKVTKFIPEFQMYDPYVSKHLTVRDLLTHRAGLGLGQGDLMFFPEGGTISLQELIHNVRYLKPANEFRDKLDYNNIMFIVAGEVISRISNQSWAEFIESRILRPVGMTSSHGSYVRAQAVKNKIDAHAPVDGVVKQIPHDWNETANAAGGIMSNVEDMLTWANFLMNGFTTKDGKKLVSDRQIQQLWQIQRPSTVALSNSYDTGNYGYGLGWFISDVKGHKQVQHSGGLIGTVTLFTLIPDMNLGIVVLTNQQSGAAFNTITNALKDSYLGIEDRNWLKTYSERMDRAGKSYQKQKEEAYAKAAQFGKAKEGKLSASKFVGTYNDLWFGDVNISQNGKGYRLECKTSPRLKGDLIAYSPNTFIVKWDDRSYDADAYLTFALDENGNATAASLKPISDITDFSFDFEDLDLQRVKAKK